MSAQYREINFGFPHVIEEDEQFLRTYLGARGAYPETIEQEHYVMKCIQGAMRGRLILRMPNAVRCWIMASLVREVSEMHT